MVADLPKANLGDYTALKEPSFWSGKFLNELMGTAFFFFGCQAFQHGGIFGAGSAMGLSYMVFGSIFSGTSLLSAFSFRNLMQKSEFGFFDFFCELASQMLGAAVGFWFFSFFGLGDSYPAAASALSFDDGFQSFFQQVVSIAFFLYLFNKQGKSNLEGWIFTIAAFSLSYAINGNMMVAGSSMFTRYEGMDMFWAVFSSSWLWTYFVQFAGAVTVASVDYFFE